MGRSSAADVCKLLLDIPLKIRPAHVFSASDGVADDIGVVGHKLGHGGQILLGIGSHEGANCSFEFGVIRGAAHGCGNPAGSSDEHEHDETKQYRTHA